MNTIRNQMNILFRFMELIPQRRKYYIVAFLSTLTNVFYNLIPAYMLRMLFQSIELKNISLISKMILFFIFSLLTVFVYNYILRTLYTNSTTKITNGIRIKIFQRLLDHSVDYINNKHSGSVISLLANDIKNIEFIYIELRVVISCMLLGIVSTILLFHTSTILGLLIATLGVIQLLIILLIIKPLQKQSKQIRIQNEKLNSTFSEMFANNMSIRLFCSEKFFLSMSRKISKNLYSSNIKLHFINTLILCINVLFGLLGYILVLTVGCKLVINNQLTIPNLLFCSQMRFMMVQGIIILGNYSTKIQPSLVAADKILDFLD